MHFVHISSLFVKAVLSKYRDISLQSPTTAMATASPSYMLAMASPELMYAQVPPYQQADLTDATVLESAGVEVMAHPFAL